MAAFAGEKRMNLAALQRVDPLIHRIIGSATQVALYCFNSEMRKWERTETEGALFVYIRSQPPKHGFVIMNRLNTTNLVEPITTEMEFQLQNPFLLYHNTRGIIYGIWFYERNECLQIAHLLMRLAQPPIPNNQEQLSLKHQKAQPTEELSLGRGKKIQPNQQPPHSKGQSRENCLLNRGEEQNQKPGKIIDIVSLLSHAQDGYNKNKMKNQRVKTRPDAITDVSHKTHPDSSAHSEIIKPVAIRGTPTSNTVVSQGLSVPVTTSLSVASLFASANKTLQQMSPFHDPVNSKNPPSVIPILKKSQSTEGLDGIESDKLAENNSATILQRLMSNPANILEHIEREQRKEASGSYTPRTRATSCSGDLGLPNSNVMLEKSSSLHTSASAQSLEQDLKEKLKLIPKCKTEDAVNKVSQSVSPVFNMSPVSSAFTSFESTTNQPKITETVPVNTSSASVSLLTPVMFEQNLKYSPPQVPVSQLPVSSTVETSVLYNDSFSTALLSQPPSMMRPPPASELPLLSPMDFCNVQSIPVLAVDGRSSKPVHTSSKPINGSGNIEDPVLLLPNHFTQGASSPKKFDDLDELPQNVSVLTRDQLRGALMHLLKDTDFVNKLHDAYVTSLKTHFSSTGS
ncbi:mRNA-decapping enzyme 1B-like isoform X2 [Limulus polyphemus]|uniref:mRNA-decapping enzyme 1B-like isoform X2 n=1 Tax=Limulus polyphemus TaxID=6850 RepID=A0ABM1T4N6_LIMPO|nr:mRNA-decapping enzyme 1B-like isoform X2 [Limulus polyphemus]